MMQTCSSSNKVAVIAPVPGVPVVICLCERRHCWLGHGPHLARSCHTVRLCQRAKVERLIILLSEQNSKAVSRHVACCEPSTARGHTHCSCRAARVLQVEPRAMAAAACSAMNFGFRQTVFPTHLPLQHTDVVDGFLRLVPELRRPLDLRLQRPSVPLLLLPLRPASHSPPQSRHLTRCRRSLPINPASFSSNRSFTCETRAGMHMCLKRPGPATCLSRFTRRSADSSAMGSAWMREMNQPLGVSSTRHLPSLPRCFTNSVSVSHLVAFMWMWCLHCS